MKVRLLKRIGHGIRWTLELAFIWFLAFPETGIYTAVFLTLVTAGLEFDHLVPSDWSKI